MRPRLGHISQPGPIIISVVFTVHDTVRAQALRVLAASTRGLTASTIADLIGTTPAQTCRALRQLEAQGLAVRDGGRGAPPQGGRAPDRWSATSR